MMRDGRALAIVVVAAAVLIALALWPTSGEPEVPGDVAPSVVADDPPPTGRAPTLEAGPQPAASPPAAPSGAPASTPGVEPDGIRVEGRVVKGMGVPAVGAEVRVVPAAPGGTSVKTDAEGRFVVWAAGINPATFGVTTVFAEDDEGRAARTTLYLMQAVSDRIDAGVLTLTTGEVLEVEVVPPPGIVGPADVYVFGEDGRMSAAWAHGRTDAAGRFRAVGLPRGAIRIVARTGGSGRAVVRSYLPLQPPGPLRVELPPDRTVEVTIVSAATGEPVEGASVHALERFGPGRMVNPRVYAPPIPPATSDAQGNVLLTGLGPADSLFLLVQADGYMPIAGSQAAADHMRAYILPGTSTLRVELQPVRTIRWPLTDRGGEQPTDGTVVRLSPDGALRGEILPTHGTIENGALVASGFGPGRIHGVAVEPGGRVAELSCAPRSDEGTATSFRDGSSVIVRVRNSDGTPAQGVWVILRGGSALLEEARLVDGEGTARFGSLAGRQADVFVAHTPKPWAGDHVGAVDLRRSVNELDVVLRAPREARLDVTVDGVASLPDELIIELGHDGSEGGLYERVVPDRIDPDGSVVFQWTPPPGRPSRPLQVRGRGTTRFGGRLYVDASHGSDSLAVPLESAGILVLDLALPSDRSINLTLERWEAAVDRWEWTDFRGGTMPSPAPNGELVLQPLRLGTYRVYDRTLLVALPTFDIRAGETTRLAWDLSRSGLVQGRVEAPEGTQLQAIDLMLYGVDVSPDVVNPVAKGAVARTGRDGTFRVRIPGDRDVVLEPRHPTLVPARQGGRVTLREPRDDVVLRLERAATFRVALDRDLVLPLHLRSNPRLAVRLFRGEPAGEPAFQIEAPLKDRVLEVGGYEPGRYTIWVDVLDAVPLVLRDVDLTGGDVDLGTHATEPGATVRLRLLVEEGAVVPRIGFSAQQDGPTGYMRGAISSGEDVITLTGLGPGTFRLRTSGQERPLPRNVDEVIESDGTGVIERTLDLR
ncbi:MAG: hypothetical protein AB7T63_01330 [Planctomycetota bacterium]